MDNPYVMNMDVYFETMDGETPEEVANQISNFIRNYSIVSHVESSPPEEA